MSWTVACFCGTVFESPAERCPACDAPVPEEVTGAPDVTESAPEVDQTPRLVREYVRPAR